MKEAEHRQVLSAVVQASENWRKAFNSGDAWACAELYETNAVMHARPVGLFNGFEEIKQFWQNLMNDGYAQVEYINTKINIIDKSSAMLTARWKMNLAKGVIHKELWCIQPDGSAKLRTDDFEIET